MKMLSSRTPFEINDVNRIVVTGPNAGGKTVALKTIGSFGHDESKWAPPSKDGEALGYFKIFPIW